jgi:nucleoside-diphosphate-sugar epimerase
MLCNGDAEMNGPVLVTGCNGFIGSRLLRWLKQRSVEATGWTRRDVDMEDRVAVAGAIGRLQPSVIFHCAAVPAQASDTDWHLVARESAMLDALADAQPEGAVLIYCGSVAEVGHSGVHDETIWCRPRTLYGTAKYAARNRALALAATGQAVRVARLFGVYGPGEGPQRLIPALVGQLVQGRPVELSDGSQIRDFVHVDDVCEAMWRFASGGQEAFPTLLNIGTGQGVTVAEVCRAVVSVLGADPDLLRFGAIPRRHVDEQILVADCSLLAKTLDLDFTQRTAGLGEKFVDYVNALVSAARS